MKRKVISFAVSVAVVSFIGYGCSSSQCKTKTAQPKAKVSVEQQVPEQTKTTTDKQLSTIFQDVHFNFDRYNLTVINKYGIKQDVPAVLDVITDFMANHPSMKIRIEGNCDERGTEEYNLALGQKRAKSAKEYLISKGIASDRIEIVSYGESKPIATGHTQKAWAKNRRDHFTVLSK